MRTTTAVPLLLTSLVFAPGCGGLDGPSDNGDPNNPGEVLVSEQQGDLTITRVDASSEEEWIYMDLETAERVEPATPEDSSEWDIAFQRFKVKINAGFSGSGTAGALVLDGVDFATLESAPACGYKVDKADGEDEGTVDDYALSIGPSSETGPWNYNPTEHTLGESDFVFVVRSVEGRTYKLKFRSYYNDVGDPGHVTFDWAELTGEGSVEGIVKVDLAAQGFTYLSLRTGQVVSGLSEPDSSTEWDVAIQSAAWATNSGGSRAGLGGARLVPGDATYGDVQTATTADYVTDEMIPFPGPPGSPEFLGNSLLTDWFDYDAVAHTAEPKNQVYLVRTADGNYAKMQIQCYEDLVAYELKTEIIPAQEE